VSLHKNTQEFKLPAQNILMDDQVLPSDPTFTGTYSLLFDPNQSEASKDFQASQFLES
jgi:hypothetical protein